MATTQCVIRDYMVRWAARSIRDTPLIASGAEIHYGNACEPGFLYLAMMHMTRCSAVGYFRRMTDSIGQVHVYIKATTHWLTPLVTKSLLWTHTVNYSSSMPRQKTSSRISIRSLSVADFHTLRVLSLDLFTKKSSLWRYAGLTAEGYLPVYDQLEKFMDLETSAIAHLPNGDIVGFFITTPFDARFNLSMANDACRAVHGILHCMDSWILENILSKQKHCEKRVLHIVGNATANGYDGLGLNKQLRNYSLMKAREGGWEMVVAETGEPIVQHLMRDVDKFDVAAHMPYDNFEIDGKRPFQGRAGGIMFFYSELEKRDDGIDARL
ncbi:hypothetical protein BJ165DRAFT_1408047 [Panaeolus papilionaceus]|nr:hypothetical protein BJ165DRAFT_1408047 [Panaeolus papilionaceus]